MAEVAQIEERNRVIMPIQSGETKRKSKILGGVGVTKGGTRLHPDTDI